MFHRGMWIRLAVSLVLGVGHLADAVEKMASGVTVTASKYDTRSHTSDEDYKGCYSSGCEPDLVLDGMLNDFSQSRWSCSEEIDSVFTECYITFDLLESFTLSKLGIYFYKSNDTDRDPNPFIVSTSINNVNFPDSFPGENILGTPLLEREDFAFPLGSVGRYVRLTGELEEDQWLSINEVEVFVEDTTPSPLAPISNALMPSSSFVPTASPSGVVSWEATLVPSFSMAPTSSPTSLSALVDELECANVTVSNIGDLDGLYVLEPDGTFLSTGTNNATIASSQSTTAVCANGASSNCLITKWTITSDVETLTTYFTYDDAEYPAQITEVWLSVTCSNTECVNAPAEVTIACGDASTSDGSLSTPSPVALTSTDCEIVEVVGTSGGELDGTYYDDGSPLQGGVAQFNGYDTINSALTSNGNNLAANWTTGGCPSPSGTAAATDGSCLWRQWRITPDDDDVGAFEYSTFDEADYPADITPGNLWYTLKAIESPYEGAINITCAPADTPALPTPQPTTSAPAVATPTPVDSSTRQPVNATNPPAEGSGAEKEDSSEDTSNMPAIIGGTAGAAALLAVVGLVTYKRMNTPPPPPSYDDLVGGS